MFYDFSVSRIQENGHTVSLSSLAIPKFFEHISIIMLGTVNTLMLSGYSEEAVAATSVATQLVNFIITALNIIITGMSIVVSIEFGKKDRETAAKMTGTAVAAMTVLSLIAGTVAAIFSEKLVELMRLGGRVGAISADFFRIRSIFVFITMLTSLFNNLLICNGYAGSTFFVGILSNVLNVILSYAVLYSEIDMPFDGVTGIAIAGIVAQAISLIAAVSLCKRKKCPFAFVYHHRMFCKILRVGVPSGLGMFSYQATQIITTGFMASLGISVLNAKVYIANIINYTSKIGLSVAQANGVLMGRYCGQKAFSKMKILYRQNLGIAVLSNTILSVLVYILYKPLISLFTDDMTIIAVAASVMAVDIVVEIARAVNNISEQSLNANGDVKTTFLAPLITCWSFGVGLAYILGISCGLGLVGCWIGFAVDEAVKATLYVIRWRSGKWKKTNV